MTPDLSIDATIIADTAVAHGGLPLIDAHQHTIEELNRLVVDYAIAFGYDKFPDYDKLDDWDHDEAIDWLNAMTITRRVWWGYHEHTGTFGCWVLEEDDQ